MRTWPCTTLLVLITHILDSRLTIDALILAPDSLWPSPLSTCFSWLLCTKEARTCLFSTDRSKSQCVFRSWRNSSTESVKGRHSSWHWVAGWT